jgi:polyhydroxyalkanoate synthesis regulator phasin
MVYERSIGMETSSGANKESEKYPRHSIYRLVRKMMLAGIGAIALKHDEMQEFVNKLVERGEIAKKDGEELMKEMRERRRQYMREEDFPHKKVAEVLEHFSVPTKNDLDELSKKINNLEKKIDKLSKSKE